MVDTILGVTLQCSHGVLFTTIIVSLFEAFCADIDECETNPCSTNGRCTNTPGSFECRCTDTTIYEGDGMECARESMIHVYIYIIMCLSLCQSLCMSVRIHTLAKG
jgi:hypothetical protein